MTIQLKTPTNKKTFHFHIDKDQIVITSQQKYQFSYHVDALKDLYEWLKSHENQAVRLAPRGEENDTVKDSVEEWARSEDNPRKGFYGLTKGRKGRFDSYIPPILEYMGFVTLTHKTKKNTIQAK